MLIDNTELVRDHFLDFQTNDEYYIVKVIVRRKDVIDNPKYEGYHTLFGSHHERFINYYTIRSIDEYDTLVPLIKNICNDNPFRAYLCTDVKSYYKSIINLNEYIGEVYKDTILKHDRLIKGNPLHYKKLEDVMKSATCKVESNVNRDRTYILLDIDNKSIEVNREIIDLMEKLRETDMNDSIRYKTFNGSHILLPFKYYKEINYQIKKPNVNPSPLVNAYLALSEREDVDVKKNAMLLLYANGNTLSL